MGLLTLGVGSGLAQTQATAPANPPSTTAAQKDDEIIKLETFVVSGIRSSAVKAIEVKRSSIPMVDVIVAEDIGKFPDNNLVEAMQRVPGVQVTDRASGEVARVSIRGLDDVSTTINGQNIFTASGASVALADIPASLLRQVDVYKTRSASTIETGIAGQIDIHTQRPFDFPGRRVVFAARGISQEQVGSFDPNLSALFSDQWKVGSEGKFGALLNVSIVKTKFRDQGVTAGAQKPYFTETPPAGFEASSPIASRINGVDVWIPGLEEGVPSAAGSTFLINGVATPYIITRDAIFATDFTGHRERPAVNLSLQYAPNKTSEYTFENFYNGYRNNTLNSMLFCWVDGWWGPNGPNQLYPGTNIVKSRSSVGNPASFTSGDKTANRTDSYLSSLGGKWDISPDFKLTSNVAYQTSKFDQVFFAMRGERRPQSVTVDFNSGGGLPAFSFPSDDMTDPSRWEVSDLYDNAYQRKGSAGTGTIDGTYFVDRGILKKLSFGARYDDRKASEAQRTQAVYGRPTINGSVIPMSTIQGLTTMTTGFYDGRSSVPSAWAVANGDYLFDHAAEIRSLYKNSIAPNLNTGEQLRLVESFDVKEVTSAAYVQSDFEAKIGGRKLEGQLGVRFVSVKTDMNGTDLSTFATSTDSVTVSKLLPSAMLRYNISDSLKLRFSYGETLRRPTFVNLNPNIIYVRDTTNIGYGTATGGNTKLKPVESKNYDLALEYYFDDASAVYVSAFKRDIEGFIVNLRRRVTYQDYDYILTQPANASNGKLDGYEFGGTYFPKNLPGLLNGLGVQVSYTMLNSSQDTPITDSAGNVTGMHHSQFFFVSDSSYSAVLAYERPRFSARLSYEWRSSFLNNYEAALFANPLGIYRKPEMSMDLQLSFRVSKNLSLTLDGTNLTNETFQSYYGNTGLSSTTNNFGSSIYSRTFAVGARYSF